MRPVAGPIWCTSSPRLVAMSACWSVPAPSGRRTPGRSHSLPYTSSETWAARCLPAWAHTGCSVSRRVQQDLRLRRLPGSALTQGRRGASGRLEAQGHGRTAGRERAVPPRQCSTGSVVGSLRVCRRRDMSGHGHHPALPRRRPTGEGEHQLPSSRYARRGKARHSLDPADSASCRGLRHSSQRFALFPRLVEITEQEPFIQAISEGAHHAHE